VANVSITFTKSSGAAFNLSFIDSNGAPAGGGSTLGFQVAGGQTRKFVSLGAGAVTDTGFAVVTSNQPVTGTAIFSQFAGARLLSEAGVPASQAFARQAIFVDTQLGFRTGMAMANPNSGAANLSLQLINTEGVQVDTTTRTLQPSNHIPIFVHELFPNAAAMAGTLQVTSNVVIPAVALRFSPDFSVFTTLPPFSIASMFSPIQNWFEQRQWVAPMTSIAKLLAGLQFRIG
jgi:hypothetical protein